MFFCSGIFLIVFLFGGGWKEGGSEQVVGGVRFIEKRGTGGGVYQRRRRGAAEGWGAQAARGEILTKNKTWVQGASH